MSLNARAFTGYEIQALACYNHQLQTTGYHDPEGLFYEPTSDPSAIACYTVYQHFTGAGVRAVGDYLTEGQARKSIVRRLALLKLFAKTNRQQREAILDATWIRAARQRYAETVEVDNDAKISHGEDPGCYVQAWVWVPEEDVFGERQ